MIFGSGAGLMVRAWLRKILTVDNTGKYPIGAMWWAHRQTHSQVSHYYRKGVRGKARISQVYPRAPVSPVRPTIYQICTHTIVIAENRTLSFMPGSIELDHHFVFRNSGNPRSLIL